MRLERVMTKEEADANASGPVWKAGTYDFEVHDASEERSKAGNDQIKLTVWVYDSQGDRKTVFDYLGAAEKVQWKVRQFASSVGLIPQYESGELDVNDIADRTGRLKLSVEKSDGYGDQNKVAAYLEAAEQSPRATRPAAAQRGAAPMQRSAAARPAAARTEIDDDSIPF